MHCPFDSHLALAELAALLTDRIRPVVAADAELLDLLDSSIGTIIRLAIEGGHPGVVASATPSESNRRAAEIGRLVATGGAELVAAIQRELPELHTREAARAALEARARVRQPPMAPPTEKALTAYLRRYFGDPSLSARNVRIVIGGNSKQTLSFDKVKGAAVEGLIMRRDFPQASNGKTVRDEFDLLRALNEAGFPAPSPVWVDAASEEVSGTFLVTRRLEGRTAGDHDGPREDLRAQALDLLAGTLAHLHGLAVDRMQLPGYSDLAFDRGVVLEMIEQYRQRDAKFWDVREPILELALRWLEANVADAIQPKVIVHGDFGFHNLFECNGRGTLLDWEMAHPGAAAEDLCRARDGLGTWALFSDFLHAYASHGGSIPSPAALRFYDVLRLTRSTINYRNAVKYFNLGINATVRRLNATAGLYVRNLQKIAELIESSVG
jgi:aminoglycoside phosphotransferase (APT) family kinase protein